MSLIIYFSQQNRKGSLIETHESLEDGKGNGQTAREVKCKGCFGADWQDIHNAKNVTSVIKIGGFEIGFPACPCTEFRIHHPAETIWNPKQAQ